MGTREFHDGAKDGLEALEPLDPEQIRSFDDLLTAMRKTAFEGRRLGEAYEVLWAMIEDPDCEPAVERLQPSLVVRGSTGAIPN